MIYARLVENLNSIHLPIMLDDLIGFLFVGKKKFNLVLLLLLESSQFVLLWHYKDLFKYLFILLLPFAWKRFIALFCFLAMCIAHRFIGENVLFILLFKQRLMYALYSLLLF